MDRLTINLNNGHAGVKGHIPDWKVVDRLAAYEDTGLEPEVIIGLCEMDKRSRMAQMLRWEEAEAEGRLIMLPCKVGDTVYQQDGVRLYESVISNIMLMGGLLIFDTPSISFDEAAIGSSIYLTRAEAETAKKEAERRRNCACVKQRWYG